MGKKSVIKQHPDFEDVFVCELCEKQVEQNYTHCIGCKAELVWERKDNAMESVKLYHGDCLEVMDRLIEEGVKVDAIITDPPYGTTKCKWDSIIPFEEMWVRLRKLRNDDTPIVLFGSEPFSSALRMSNIKEYKYDLIWDKNKGTQPALANVKPMQSHENLNIFYFKKPTYNPQMEIGKPYFRNNKGFKGHIDGNHNINLKAITQDNKGTRYPKSILKFSRDFSAQSRVHPTQKPVALMEYLIKTYTNEGDTVLDFTMGSGTTGVACIRTNRKFVGIELDENYFDIARERIDNAREQSKDKVEN